MKRTPRVCSVAHCDRLANYGHTMCPAHVQRRHVGADMSKPVEPRHPATIRDDRGYKQCRKCEQWMPEDGFYTNRPHTADGLMYWCKECHKAAQRERTRIRRERSAGGAA